MLFIKRPQLNIPFWDIRFRDLAEALSFQKAYLMTKSLGTDEWKEFLSLLREARTSAGMTQKQIADILKRPQSFIAKVEGGERRLDVIEFRDWAKAIGTAPDQLLAEIERRLSNR